MSEEILNLGENKATDPTLLPTPYVTPPDFTAQYPQPLDTTELIAMCEEVTLLASLPERRTNLNAETWRELNSLAFNSGSSYISFADGACPESYTHNGANTTVSIKNIGAKKSLSEREILHSSAVAGANWNGINRLNAPIAAHSGLPGTSGNNSDAAGFVADLKAKETTLQAILVLNGEDRLLVQGDHVTNSLEYTGIQTYQTNYSVSFHTNDNDASGTFASTAFDRFLSESCATPTALMGHPQAIQELMSSYFQLGWQGSQVVNVPNGSRVVPGFNFASRVNTGVGELGVVADRNFTITDMGNGAFQASIWAFRMTHNGVPLVSRITQIPMELKDLVEGCTTINFQVWKATALVIKHACAHGQYTSQFTGRSSTTCPIVGA